MVMPTRFYRSWFWGFMVAPMIEIAAVPFRKPLTFDIPDCWMMLLCVAGGIGLVLTDILGELQKPKPIHFPVKNRPSDCRTPNTELEPPGCAMSAFPYPDSD